MKKLALTVLLCLLNIIEQIILYEKCNILFLINEINKFYIDISSVILKVLLEYKGLKSMHKY